MERRLITVPFGPFQSNMYVVAGPSGVFVVDPSVSPKKAEAYTDIKGLSTGECDVKCFLLTHGHYDHIKYVNEWIEAYPDAKVFFSSKDEELLGSAYMNCSYMDGLQVTFDFEYENISGTDSKSIYKDDDTEIKVFETPGHTEGSVCFLVDQGEDKMLFTGDTVFQGSIGRTDMPGGSMKVMSESLKKFASFDQSLKIYPGHGPDSSVGDEVKFNPFF